MGRRGRPRARRRGRRARPAPPASTSTRERGWPSASRLITRSASRSTDAAAWRRSWVRLTSARSRAQRAEPLARARRRAAGAAGRRGRARPRRPRSASPSPSSRSAARLAARRAASRRSGSVFDARVGALAVAERRVGRRARAAAPTSAISTHLQRAGDDAVARSIDRESSRAGMALMANRGRMSDGATLAARGDRARARRRPRPRPRLRAARSARAGGRRARRAARAARRARSRRTGRLLLLKQVHGCARARTAPWEGTPGGGRVGRRAAPGCCSASRPRTACRCCSWTRAAARWRPRTPAGGAPRRASPRAAVDALRRGRLATRATWWPRSGPASAPAATRWARSCATAFGRRREFFRPGPRGRPHLDVRAANRAPARRGRPAPGPASTASTTAPTAAPTCTTPTAATAREPAG